MSLKTIAELLKNAPCAPETLSATLTVPIDSGFKRNLIWEKQECQTSIRNGCKSKNGCTYVHTQRCVCSTLCLS